jgi:hypothetical protein
MKHMKSRYVGNFGKALPEAKVSGKGTNSPTLN